ncbi:MAG TPA: transcriptional regulator [Plantibacter sp.]|uniref:transcriptional regulator n=1 Tax=unclassified Plantibacter TaxID=2624265 RepID=UPI002B6F42DB|nr:transcriptional regulator [Plantibacter sp.]
MREGDDSAEPARPALNPLFHEPARLVILSALAPAEYIDFAALLLITGVSKSALSKHLSALADAGMVDVGQTAADKRGRRVVLTGRGRAEFDVYLEALEAIVRNARR